MSMISPNGYKVYTRQTADGMVHSSMKNGKVLKNVYQNNDGTTKVADLQNGTETNIVKTETDERKEFDSVKRDAVTGDLILAYNRVYVKDNGDVVERVETQDGAKVYLNGHELTVVDDDCDCDDSKTPQYSEAKIDPMYNLYVKLAELANRHPSKTHPVEAPFYYRLF